MKSLVLFGYRCTGKTQKGKIIAKNLGYDFIDADNLVISKLKSEGYVSITDFVKNLGWPEFRKIENQVLEEIVRENKKKPIVLSLGGGAVANTQSEIYRLKNISLIKQFGVSFYLLPFEDLKKTSQVLAKRQLRDKNSSENRPDLNSNAAAVLDYKTLVENNFTELHIRDPMYRAAADYVMLTLNKPQERVAKEIIDLYKLELGSR